MPGLVNARYLAALMLGSLFFQGCFSDSGTETGVKAKPYTGPPLKLAIVPGGIGPRPDDSSFWDTVYAGAHQATLDLGNVEISWHAPVGDDLAAHQNEIVHNLIHEKVDGIVLAPSDSRNLVEMVDEAIDAGIPVVIAGTNLEAGPEIVSHVTTNHAYAGQLAAEAMADAIDHEGNIILLRYLFNDEMTQQREDGILDEFKKHRKIKVVSDDQRGGEDAASAQIKMGELLAYFGSDLAGIIVSSGANADGALEALREAQRSDETLAGKIKFITFDPGSSMIAATKDGSCSAVIVQDPYEIGYRSVVTMVNHLSGKKVKRFIATGEYVVTQENIDDKKSQRLLGK